MKVVGKPLRDFMKRAGIPPAFGRAVFQLPRQQSVNDDVEIESYRPTKLILPGKQREVIREPLDFCSSFGEHTRYALKDPFPLSSVSPLPRDLKEEALFPRDMPLTSLFVLGTRR